MSGWDTSSRPTWGQPDGPDDSQHPDSDHSADQANPWDRLSAQPPGDARDAREADGFGSAGSGGFADAANGFGGSNEETAAGYPRRTPGRTLSQQGFGLGQPGPGQPTEVRPAFGQPDLPRREARGRHSSGAHEQPASASQGTAPWEVPTDQPSPPVWGGGASLDQANGDVWGRPAQPGQGRSIPPWEEPPRESARPDLGVQASDLRRLDPDRADFARPDLARPDLGRPDLGQPDFGRADPERPDFGRPELERPDFARPGFAQPAPDVNRPDYAQPAYAQPVFNRQDGLGQDYPGRDDFSGPQAGSPDGTLSGNGDRPGVARMDPALQDFFAPPEQRQERQEPQVPGRPHSARPDDFRPPLPPPGMPAPGMPAPGMPAPGQRGGSERGGLNGYPEPGPRLGAPGLPPRGGRPVDDDWAAPPLRSPRPPIGRETGSSRIARTTGAIRALRGDEPSFGKRVYFTVGAILILIVVVVLILTHQHGGGKPAPSASSVLPPGTIPSSTPSVAKTSAASTPPKPATSPVAKPVSGFVLSTPATAGGYPKGRDPHFLATATGTAQQIAATVKSGGGGRRTGSPVSAAYQLPSGGQVITFVGYQGTFTPAKIATILGSIGTDQSTYPAGVNGGTFGCANTPASGTTPSGAVCVWATANTLGVTEFFSSTAPEVLTVSQAKGAADAAKLRLSVEAKHS